MFKNTVNKKRECILCHNLAINSHLLQKNGILSHIQGNGHVKQLKFNDIYKSNKEDSIIISNVGLKKAMTYKVFCNSHDSKIFKEIESTEINLESYRTNILLTYRALCAEIIKKDISIECINKIKNASYFKLQFDFLKNVEFTLNENLKSKKELIWYKNEISKFKRYWNENYYNINVNQKIDFDIFHNSNK